MSRDSLKNSNQQWVKMCVRVIKLWTIIISNILLIVESKASSFIYIVKKCILKKYSFYPQNELRCSFVKTDTLGNKNTIVAAIFVQRSFYVTGIKINSFLNGHGDRMILDTRLTLGRCIIKANDIFFIWNSKDN